MAAMAFPPTRMRRLRRTDALRGMVRETRLEPADLVQPLFVTHGTDVDREIPSLPGQRHLSIDRLVEEAARVHEAGVPAIILFGLPDHKDEAASSAYDEEGVVQLA